MFLALLVGTALTVSAARTWPAEQRRDARHRDDEGDARHPVLHARTLEHALTWVVAVSGFFWLLILFSITMADYGTRGWVTGTLR